MDSPEFKRLLKDMGGTLVTQPPATASPAGPIALLQRLAADASRPALGETMLRGRAQQLTMISL